MQPLDRHVLDQRRVLVDFEELLWRIDQEHDVLSGKSLLDVVGFLIDLDAAIGADATHKGVPVNALEPAIRIDRFGDCWQFGQGRKGHARWLILARATLMRPFIVVMLHEALSHFTYLLQGGRPMYLETLLIVASVISLDVGIFIWALRRANIGLDTQAEQEAAKRRGKITATGTSDPSGISIEGQHGRKAIGTQEGDHSEKTPSQHENHHVAEPRAVLKCRHRQN